MIQGNLKRKRKKERLKRSIVKSIATVASCSIAVALAFTLYAETKQKATVESEIAALGNDEKTVLSAGVHLAITDTTVVDVEKTETVIVQQANKIEEAKNLVSAGTLLYASTNINARVEPSAESDRVCGVPFGSKVEVISDNGDGWLKVLYKNNEVYVCQEYLTEGAPMQLVSSTAYWDKYNRTSASGRELIEGYSVAGKVAWLHKKVNIYKCNPDGSIGDFLGTYRFDDTGYGQETGEGESKILKGRTIGTIENGTCIDFYFENEDDCWNYGRRNVYIQVLD